MGNNQPKVVSIREVNQTNPTTRQLEPYMVVTFTVGNHGPFQESFLKSTLDPSGINARLTDFAQKLSLVQGQ